MRETTAGSASSTGARSRCPRRWPGWDRRRKALAGKLDGELLDLEREVSVGGTLEPVLAGSEDGLSILRHSCAHLMAQAIENLYANTRKHLKV